MLDPNTVVVKTSLNITVSHKVVKTNLDLLQPYFTEIEPYYTDSKPNSHEGVVRYCGVDDLLKRLNTYISNNKKFDAPAILKGTYKGGTSGQYCTNAAPFLFFDVDVKGDENKPLQDSFKNAAVFEHLQKIAVCVWRSNSQKGMAGILYVPQLEEVTKAETGKHLKIGNSITTYLSNTLKQQGLSVEFDKAQNKFRQVRFLAEQKEVIELNTDPFVFTYEQEEVEAKNYNGVKQYKFKTPRAVHGSIRDQFNSNNPIDIIILSCGFEKVNGTNRFKHFNTTSSSSGSIDPLLNIFYNHSSGFSNKKAFDPFGLVLYTQYDNNYKAFLDALRTQNYREKQLKQCVVEAGLKRLKKPNITHKEVFAALYDLRNLPLAEKLAIIKENCRTEDERQVYCSYLKCKNLIVSYDTFFEVDNYVSEVLSDVLKITEAKKKVILRAETGTGKTTAFLRDFLKHRPNKKCLILAPLTTIVDQSVNDYKNIIGLTGKSQPSDHTKSKTANIVVATYEQGTKHLESQNNFDFIVIDEVHNLFLAHDYKSETISKLTALLEYKNVIGLTGTPSNLFRNLGYSLLSVSKRMQKPVQIIQRVDNRNASKIIIQHLNTAKGKCIFRINSTKILQGVKAELVKQKRFKENEIVILFSSPSIKKSYDYSQVVETSKFAENVQVVLTTGLIDEGINIKQFGFTDVVFIESDYTPNPEPLKQFFARFRLEEGTRKNYHYYRKKKDQEVIYWNEKRDYAEKLELLTNDNINDFNTYMDITNDNKFYYSSRKINEYYLAFEVGTTFFKRFNQQEFNYYLAVNFNVNIQIEKDYLKECIDISEIKQSARETKTKVCTMLLNNWEEVEIAVSRITTDKELKKKIEDIGLPIIDSTLDFVQSNIKVFERFTSYYYQLIDAGVTEPINYLIDGTKLIDARVINLTLKIKETINLIENPITTNDRKNEKKLKSFFRDVEEQKYLDKTKVFQLWKKQRIVNKASSQNGYLIALIQEFTKWNYDPNNKRYFFNQ
ncbi:DEAD/DEAH box helicase family protein [Zobellia laminariae]|uniref:DEAD/DEAH box helicase family protein n=1 Tax=Zobellia laminariae TaxID=248906 RepID=UPI0012D9049B|nr:DEAD/DEAH box helicase [Zobellia laminariae]